MQRMQNVRLVIRVLLYQKPQPDTFVTEQLIRKHKSMHVGSSRFDGEYKIRLRMSEKPLTSIEFSK